MACVRTAIPRARLRRKMFNTHNSLMSIFRPAARSARSDVCERIHRLRRTDGCRALGLCAVWTAVWCGLSRCTRVRPYSVRYRVAERTRVRALWCGTVRCGAVRSGARVRRAVVPLWSVVGETFFSTASDFEISRDDN